MHSAYTCGVSEINTRLMICDPELICTYTNLVFGIFVLYSLQANVLGAFVAYAELSF